jgi:hypothetical protein
MDAVERILEHWRAEGVALKAGATIEDLSRLERFLGCGLPDDVRRFYLEANGMEDFVHDSKRVSFWSIDRILREKDFAPAGDEARGSAFADVMLYSWTFRYGLRAGMPISVMADGARLEHTSFSTFLTQYLEDPGSMGLVDAV